MNTVSAMAPEAAGMPQLLDWRAACAFLGGSRPISRATLDRLTKAGALKVRRPAPGVVRWAAEDIAEYLNSVTFPKAEVS
jgi:predicted DNA-binding transcriptional regulator AlpA